jgi:hypothetical protein
MGRSAVDGQQYLLTDLMVVLRLSSEFDHLHDIKISAEKHEPVDG